MHTYPLALGVSLGLPQFCSVICPHALQLSVARSGLHSSLEGGQELPAIPRMPLGSQRRRTTRCVLSLTAILPGVNKE